MTKKTNKWDISDAETIIDVLIEDMKTLVLSMELKYPGFGYLFIKTKKIIKELEKLQKRI